jgi:hypothetical protein
MGRFFHFFIVFLLLACPLFAMAAPPPLPFSAVYTVKKNGFDIGETKRELSVTEDGHFVFKSMTRPIGIAKLLTSGQVVERSEWHMVDGELQPLTYTYFNSGTKVPRNVQISFDWKHRVIVNNINGDLWQMGLEDGTQDKLLYQLSIMQDLQDGETDMKYPVADGGRLKIYHFEWQGVETINIPAGTFDTVRMRRVHGKTTTTIWCARKLNFLPVRIQQQKRGDSASVAVLKSVQGLGNTWR